MPALVKELRPIKLTLTIVGHYWSMEQNLKAQGGRPNDAFSNTSLWHVGARRTVVAAWFVAVLVSFAISLTAKAFNLSIIFLLFQDRWLLLIGCGLLLAASYRLPKTEVPFKVGVRLPLIVAAILLATCFAGHYLILAGYDMSRDEQMATFDAAIFADGRLVQPLPQIWRDHADVLNLTFMVPAEHRAAWISAYLPFNAALRALASLFATQALVGPLMTTLGALALWGCARRIWPSDREAPVVALLLYLGSAQIVITGMTTYAMPAHLTLNLVWLWLFVRRSFWADMAALAVGFVAVGLHQPLMHPLFAGPLLFLLILPEREWGRAAFFALGYAAIGAFWFYWPNWTWSLVQVSADAQRPDGVDYLTRLRMTVQQLNPKGMADMFVNILRFIAWQHLLLLPLLLIGVKIAYKDRLAGALATGVILTTIVMAVILPYQGHGFGYRYLHGLIGNCILVAVFAWKSLGAEQAKWRTLLLRSSVAGIAILLPLQAWMAQAFYAPAAGASAKIAAIDADYAVIGENDVPFSADLVFNPPQLDRRPVRLLREKLDLSAITAICSTHPTVALVGNRALQSMAEYYSLPAPRADRANRAFSLMLERAGCQPRIVG